MIQMNDFWKPMKLRRTKLSAVTSLGYLSPNTLGTVWFAISVMPMWLNKASLLHLPLLEPFKQDVTVSSSEPTMLTFASTGRATVQFSILMLSWHNSRLCGLDLHSHLRRQACMFSLTFCIFRFLLVMHSSCSGLHD